MIRMFIGYDDAETVAYHVFTHSIQKRSSVPVAIAPVMVSQIKEFTRDRDKKQSNDFSFSRWMVPYLCNYRGWAIWADCDMICQDDINKLWGLRDDRFAVQVVKHDHKPREKIKYLGQKQLQYEKKNWSSVMLFNCAKCSALTPDYVNKASGLQLHQFKWLENEKLIGPLPHRWNILVGYDDIEAYPEPGFLHYTTGGPYFKEYRNCDTSDLWLREWADAMHCRQIV